MKLFKLFLISLLVVPIFACSAKSAAVGTNTSNETKKVEDVLSDREFTYEKYPSIMIGFRNGGVYGYALINTYMGRYQVLPEGKIRMSYMAYTKIDGPNEYVDGEYEYFSALEKSKTFSYDKSKGILIIGGLKFIEKK